MNAKQWVALFIFFVGYLLLGGIVFMVTESAEEEVRLQELGNLKNVIYDKLIMCEGTVIDPANVAVREEIWAQIAKQINQPVLIYNSSVPSRKWTLFNSFFVAVTAATTIGYGHLAPSTSTGRIFCIFFALVGIPLNGILFATLGNYFGSKVSKVVKRPRKRKRGRFTAFLLVLTDILLYSIPGLIVFLVIPAGLFTVVEGWDYVDSFYYTFISLSTIGFGDLVAGQNDVGQWTWVYRSFISVWILLGLGYLIMIINIITKGLRSNPLVAPVKRMAARIRATRNLLAKDAVALRRLVQEIRAVKTKRVRRPGRVELLRTFSHPTLLYEEPRNEKDSPILLEVIGNDGFNHNTVTYLDRGVECNNGSFRKPLETTELNEDPLELLTRLAIVLCNDNEEDDLSFPETTVTEDDHSLENREVGEESAFERIYRSFRVSEDNNDNHSCSPSPVKVQEVFQTENEHRIVSDRRVRHASDSHRQSVLNCSGSRHFILGQETNSASEFKRSNSEKFKPDKNLAPSFILTPPLDWSRQLKENLLGGTICDLDNTVRMELPNADVINLCDMLDQVQTSRQNNSPPPTEE